MILHGHEDDPGKENDVCPAESAEGKIRGGQGGGRHEEDAYPDSEKPDQTDVIGRLPLDDSHDERDIEKRQKSPRPRTDLVKNIHNVFSWYLDPIDSRGQLGTVVSDG